MILILVWIAVAPIVALCFAKMIQQCEHEDM